MKAKQTKMGILVNYKFFLSQHYMAAKKLATLGCINVQMCNIQSQFSYTVNIILNSEQILEGTLTKCNAP